MATKRFKMSKRRNRSTIERYKMSTKRHKMATKSCKISEIQPLKPNDHEATKIVNMRHKMITRHKPTKLTHEM